MIAGAVLVVVVVWGLVLGAKTMSAYHHDRIGLAALEQVKADLSPGNLTSSTSTRLLDQAHAEFVSAQADLSSPLFAPVTVVPVLGRQFRAVQDLSSAAGTVSAVGSSFIAQVQSLLDRPHTAGPERVASLQQLGAFSLSADRQLAAIDTGPSQGLFAPLARKHNEFVNQLYAVQVRLTKAAAVSAVVASILKGPETYLVLAANNAEMRSGSGAFLDVGVATTSQGSINLSDFEPSGDHILPVGAIVPSGDFQRNWGWLDPGVDFRNLGLTPQFNVTAPLAARMWTALTGQKVDGVLALDVAGVEELLQVSGPVSVDGQTVGASNVVQYLLHDQYAGLTDTSGGGTQRQDALGDLTRAVLHQLESQSSDLRTLGTAVTSAVAGRHLMMWSAGPVAQSAWEVSGVSGALTPGSVGVSLINRGGNKLDPFVPIHVTVDTARSGSDTSVTMSARVTNDTPPGLSQFIAGPFPGVPVTYGGYFGLMAVNLPGAARHITVSGIAPVYVKGPEGPTWVLAAPLNLADGNSVTAVVHFVMPGPHGSMTVVPSARIPAEQWTASGRTFTDAIPTPVTW